MLPGRLPIRIIASLLAISATVAAPGYAQVDCSNPDNLCTGDPCIIPSLAVTSPCVVDFGARTVVVDGALRVPRVQNGLLDLTAARIEVPGTIRPVGTGLFMPAYSLTAIQDVIVSGRISGTQQAFAGSAVTVIAGGNIELGGSIRAEKLVAEAGGVLTVTGRLRHASHDLRGAAAVVLASGSINNRGGTNFGGDLDISSSGGDVTIGAPIVANHLTGSRTQLTAAGDVAINRSISIIASGGPLFMDAGANVTIVAPIRIRGSSPALDIDAGGTVTLSHKIFVDMKFFAGTVRVDAASVEVGSAALIDASPANPLANPQTPAAIRLNATAGNMLLAGTFLVRAGIIEGAATGDLTASGTFVVVGGAPGCISLTAGGTLDTSAGTFDQPIVADCPG
jgi:hypothetical protein